MEARPVQPNRTGPAPSPRFARLARGYRTAAVLFLNTCLLLALANGVLWLLGWPPEQSLDSLANRVLGKYGQSLIQSAYPHRTLEEIRQLHAETWAQLLVYDGFAGYKEPARKGRHVNVDVNGFRHVADQGPWPPDTNRFNVFVFGGSTTFGYGVADDETIPSRLQEQLRQHWRSNEVSVYNFGRAYYYSSQERVLFERLLVGGFVPDAAVFIDGLNELIAARDEPMRPHHLTAESDAEHGGLRRLPLARLIDRWLSGSSRRRHLQGTGLDQILSDDPVDACRLRLERNHRLIRRAAAAFGVRPLFVIQPIPYHLPNRASMPFGRIGNDMEESLLYERMDRDRKAGATEPDLMWAADLHVGQRGILYVVLQEL